MNWDERLPRPDAGSINTWHAPCPIHELCAKYGSPRDELSDQCEPVTNPHWAAMIETVDVGPFRLTGHSMFLSSLSRAFGSLRHEDPLRSSLYASLGTAGCLCCRRIRGTLSSVSAHALGLAVDLTVDGQLVQRGDDHVQRGMLEVYAVAKGADLYWGAGFSTCDSMHFEASAELIHTWGWL